MKRVLALVMLFVAIFAAPVPVSAAPSPDDDPTITEGLRDKGIDWLKDKAKGAGKDWIFETGQSATMKDILEAARLRADGEGNANAGLCQGAVMGKASSILDDLNYKTTAQDVGLYAFETASKLVSLASGFGAAAGEGNAVNWIVQQYREAAEGAAKDSVFDAVKKLFVDEKKPEFELFEEKDKENGPCGYTLRAEWDIVHATYRVYIAGDCHCAEVGNAGAMKRPLGAWWISFEGKLQLEGDKDKGLKWTVLPVSKMDFDAQCACSKRPLRKAFTPRKPPETESAGPGTPSRPPVPPAGRKVCKDCQKIQDEIDADTKALAAAVASVKRARDDLKAAEDRLAYAKAHPTPGQSAKARQSEIEGDEREVEAAHAESRDLEWQQVVLDAALRDLGKLLEECIKAHCPDGHSSIPKSSNEQFAAVLPPRTGCDPQPLSAFASAVVAIHNRERAEVGAQPLCWNAALAVTATAYARQVAMTQQLIHAPREGRGIERENLLRFNIGWSAERMMQIWTTEKRDFVPGYFPNVARGGNWLNVAHYTQMIWPTTTDIGCGTAQGGGYGWLVCRYSPGGNKDGKPVGNR